MARLLGMCLVLGFAMAVAAVRPSTTVLSQADGGCDNDLQQLIANCQDYVMLPDNPKVPPSPACCKVVRHANVPCLCSKVTKEIEKLISMEKVVYVAGYCKRPFKPGSKCGSYQIPGLFA